MVQQFLQCLRSHGLDEVMVVSGKARPLAIVRRSVAGQRDEDDRFRPPARRGTAEPARIRRIRAARCPRARCRGAPTSAVQPLGGVRRLEQVSRQFEHGSVIAGVGVVLDDEHALLDGGVRRCDGHGFGRRRFDARETD